MWILELNSRPHASFTHWDISPAPWEELLKTFFNYTYLFYFLGLHMHCPSVCVEVRDSQQEALSFYHVSSKDQAQVSELGSKHLYPL